MSLSKATAAPVEVSINGHTFVVHPPTFSEFGDFESWSERDLLRQCIEEGGDVQKHVLRGAKASGAMIQTTRGKLHFAVQVLRKSDPEITVEVLEGKVSSMDGVMKIVNAAIEQALPEKAPGEKEDPDREPF